MPETGDHPCLSRIKATASVGPTANSRRSAGDDACQQPLELEAALQNAQREARDVRCMTGTPDRIRACRNVANLSE
jgi:hypothetical protein